MFDVFFIFVFKDNYIWLLIWGDCVFVVDFGDVGLVLVWLDVDGLRLEGILIMYYYVDYQGGVVELKKCFEIVVFVLEVEFIIGCIDVFCGGESIMVFGYLVDVMVVFGYMLGYFVYYVLGLLFCGDILFGVGCGCLFEGMLVQMVVLLDCIVVLLDDMLIYCVYEYIEMNLCFVLVVELENQVVLQWVVKVVVQWVVGLLSVLIILVEEKVINFFLCCGELVVIVVGL